MTINKVTGNKKEYLDLLLLADEQESMIDRYLERGEMYVLHDGGVKAECVVTREAEGVFELKNIAVRPDCQRKGYGKALIDAIFSLCPDCRTLYVGTGDTPSSLGFYHACGFADSHRVKDFFTDNYDHVMIEDGIQLVDMVYLKRRRDAGVEILRIREHAALAEKAAAWFHEKWGVPLDAYRASIGECIGCASPVPQWYVAVDGENIVGGIGVIDNDFHDRPDLTPNVCAVRVEEGYRNRGLAGRMLDFVCGDMAALGINTLYLLTSHDSFYEKYGWRFLCMAQGDGDRVQSRMYVREIQEDK